MDPAASSLGRLRAGAGVGRRALLRPASHCIGLRAHQFTLRWRPSTMTPSWESCGAKCERMSFKSLSPHIAQFRVAWILHYGAVNTLNDATSCLIHYPSLPSAVSSAGSFRWLGAPASGLAANMQESSRWVSAQALSGFVALSHENSKLALPQTAKCGLLVTVGLCSSSVPAFLLCGFDCCREST